ncbi:MAG: hypothetical protein PCFJNLEI_00665 [Verrucomicrobiae bacterium]|nr:hypothetical protein [Verrucomicrobiae bacterium]
MARSTTERKQFLTDLYSGPFPGHGICMLPQSPPDPLADFTCSTEPVARWVPALLERYELLVRYTEALDLDCVPSVNLNTNTGVFAAAFGCPLHVFQRMETNACALPAVTSAAEADALPQPELARSQTLARILELGSLLRDRLGPEVPIGVPDIQSPFDIAALVWKKEDLFAAMIEAPDSVNRLVGKCHRLLTDFLQEFKRMFPNCNLSHCPVTAWAPPDLGCWLSEDEAGSISAAMFEEFMLPTLVAMSETFGGMGVHCCAAADHQYANFQRIPNLRALNRVFQNPPGPEPAIRLFSSKTVLIQAWLGEAEILRFLDLARSDTRYFFELSAMTIEQARPVVARLREACAATQARHSSTSTKPFSS